jgi:hypothetical protein
VMEFVTCILTLILILPACPTRAGSWFSSMLQKNIDYQRVCRVCSTEIQLSLKSLILCTHLVCSSWLMRNHNSFRTLKLQLACDFYRSLIVQHFHSSNVMPEILFQTG